MPIKQSAIFSKQLLDEAVRNGTQVLSAVPKADVHNHCCLGYPLAALRSKFDPGIPEPPSTFSTFTAFTDYIGDHLREYVFAKNGFEFSVRANLEQAKKDGVTKLETSIDASMLEEYENANALGAFLIGIAEEFPEVDFRPELGINREWDMDYTDPIVRSLLATEVFQSIDLYGDETTGMPEQYVDYYKIARECGMLCKAHAGEYLDADFVKRSVEVLQLDQVQHGISSAESAEVMRFLAEHKIQLNVCPTSNVVLQRSSSINAHPIKKLFDAGVPVTINSDDIMIFNSTVSQEYLKLYTDGVFSADELEEIRTQGIAD